MYYNGMLQLCFLIFVKTVLYNVYRSIAYCIKFITQYSKRQAKCDHIFIFYLFLSLHQLPVCVSCAHKHAHAGKSTNFSLHFPICLPDRSFFPPDQTTLHTHVMFNTFQHKQNKRTNKQKHGFYDPWDSLQMRTQILTKISHRYDAWVVRNL